VTPRPRHQVSRASASVGALFVVRSLRGKLGGVGFWRSRSGTARSQRTSLSSCETANLVVSLLNGKYKATYYKPPGRPNLILRERTKTDDEALVAEAFQAAVAKARELGWIV
jgi:hypothetical protein